MQDRKKKYCDALLSKGYSISDGTVNTDLQVILKEGKDYIFNVELHFEHFKFQCDALKKIPEPKPGGYSYIPVLVWHEGNVPMKAKILATGMAHVLGNVLGAEMPTAQIVYGADFKSTTVKTENYFKEFNKIFESLKESEKFPFHLNQHCNICEFATQCREKAVSEDHLSLLKGISQNRIKQLNQKGIFTINQLSYTFRPKRKPPKKENRVKTRSVELHALAIRENKIFIYDTPAPMPQAKAQIFLDMCLICFNPCYCGCCF